MRPELKDFALALTLTVAALTCGLTLGSGTAHAEPADGHPEWPGAGQLFVGTNYQSFDRSREQILEDIARMKSAGFKVVRMGDLSWDSFEPAEGRFEFGEPGRFPFTLSVTAGGFARFERVWKEGEWTGGELRVVLSPAGFAERVTVTAARTETRLAETLEDPEGHQRREPLSVGRQLMDHNPPERQRQRRDPGGGVSAQIVRVEQAPLGGGDRRHPRRQLAAVERGPLRGRERAAPR